VSTGIEGWARDGACTNGTTKTAARSETHRSLDDGDRTDAPPEPEHLASGRLALETVDLENFEPGQARFDKVFAVNVNAFWTTPATEELARIRRALERDGRLFLFFETPSAARARRTVTRVVDALQANDFAEPELISRSTTLVGCVAQLA
jgi:hypothetical protein